MSSFVDQTVKLTVSRETAQSIKIIIIIKKRKKRRKKKEKKRKKNTYTKIDSQYIQQFFLNYYFLTR